MPALVGIAGRGELARCSIVRSDLPVLLSLGLTGTGFSNSESACLPAIAGGRHCTQWRTSGETYLETEICSHRHNRPDDSNGARDGRQGHHLQEACGGLTQGISLQGERQAREQASLGGDPRLRCQTKSMLRQKNLPRPCLRCRKTMTSSSPSSSAPSGKRGRTLIRSQLARILRLGAKIAGLAI